MPRKLALWFALLIAGFLTGFILQYARVQRLQQELSATMMYLEVVEKNYGKAGEYSKEFFDQAQRIVSSTEDPTLRNLLRDTLTTRDQITADLAKGDAAALSEIQLVLSKLEQTAKH